jgi:prepilin-type N-terminal cleavage/methylation domain-containing protein
LKFTAKSTARPWGFTLIELLTVIAIIAVLATLLTATLGTARKKARKTSSISNLRQIAIAFDLYRDDHGKRPAAYALLTQGKYLTERTLHCAEDRSGDWAGTIENVPLQFTLRAIAPGLDLPPEAAVEEIPHSYFKSFHLEAEQWDEIERNPLAGIAACQLHGIGRQEREMPPTLETYQGLVLRALKDGSVISRQVFWNNDKSFDAGTAPSFIASVPSNSSTIPLFLDPLPEP